jgi:hypothetical protein
MKDVSSDLFDDYDSQVIVELDIVRQLALHRWDYVAPPPSLH